MRPLYGIITALVVAALIVATWFLTKKNCPASDCSKCPTPDCPTPDCPECPNCPSPDCPTCPSCPECPSCPAIDCAKDCPYSVPDNLTIDLTSNPPSAVFLGIPMNYEGQDPNVQSLIGDSAVFSYQGLPNLSAFASGGGVGVVQVNAFYDPAKPVVFAQLTTNNQAGTFSDNKIIPVSITVGKY